VEINEKQIVSCGSDYAVISKVGMEGLEWQKAVPAHRGDWVADKTSLIGLLSDAIAVGDGEVVRINIDAISEKMMVTAKSGDGDRFQKSITVKRFEGPASVCVGVNPNYLLDAASACTGGLVHLLFEDTKGGPSIAPIVVRGEDEDFLAVIAPYGGNP
jgi:DNA polymerase III sliding clamp (beta) subunit (PCNA family)